jgi:hypothetical protein
LTSGAVLALVVVPRRRRGAALKDHSDICKAVQISMA